MTAPKAAVWGAISFAFIFIGVVPAAGQNTPAFFERDEYRRYYDDAGPEERAALERKATERMVRLAAEKGVAEQDITRAIFEGRFVPTAEDLRLATKGLLLDGELKVSPELAKELERIDAIADNAGYKAALKELEKRIDDGSFKESEGEWLPARQIVWYRNMDMTGRGETRPENMPFAFRNDHETARYRAWNRRFGRVADLPRVRTVVGGAPRELDGTQLVWWAVVLDRARSADKSVGEAAREIGEWSEQVRESTFDRLEDIALPDYFFGRPDPKAGSGPQADYQALLDRAKAAEGQRSD